ncbi:hypothetical protein EZ456_13570 [Pedobacter psychrodurus]|uniref:Uncharacterized protein n=1 Tax=Pedobacter psychrodurus TaxID=2530456 RepID=A0A4R0PUX7_9SPHI|nr:hypothetical protein [Pedobacter psychrodurus]TCD26323.1 hypothetical protein EZ456_13570 [Pedobacter psychrodurus]
MNEITNIENSLEASTVKDNLLDIIGGSADYSIEKFLDMGDGIPIVSYFTKGFKATLAVRDFLFMEKIIEFLREIGEEPTTKRKKMIDKIQEDLSYSQKFGKVSLVAIERFDDIEKAKLLGQTARYLARGEITYSLYKRVAFIIGRLYLADILSFGSHEKSLVLLNFTADLEALGLTRTDWGMVRESSDHDGPQVGSRIKITDLGKVVKCIITNNVLSTQVPSGINVVESLEERMKREYP